MRQLSLSFFFALFAFFLLIYPVNAEQPHLFKVLKVIDGDTIVVDVRGKKETVRLLGIDTPETVDRRKPVECFGKAASAKMKAFAQGKSVILVDDRTQGNRDSYKRLLRYVYLPDNKRTFVNGEMVKQGYAFSYRQYPSKMLTKFNNLEKYAQEHNAGLWSSCPAKEIGFPTSTPAQSAPVYSVGGDKDCADFATHAQAQTYFTSKGGSASNNVDRLDNNHDGIACETLP
jgi:micrococcal nuclease